MSVNHCRSDLMTRPLTSDLRLKIRYHLPDVLIFYFRDGRGMTQIALALFSFARQQVALETLVAFHLAAARHSESFCRSSIGFNLRHLDLLLLRTANRFCNLDV